MNSIAAMKIAQASDILREKGVDMWITFTRETSLTPDPAANLILGEKLTSQTALVITSKGETVAVTGVLDSELVRSFGTVEQYSGSVIEPLAGVIKRLAPTKIAINFSKNDPSADGLTHGMFLKLEEIIHCSGVRAEIVSSEEIIHALRGRKTPEEISLLRQAAKVTGKIFDSLRGRLKAGVTDNEVAENITRLMKEHAPNSPPTHLIITAGKDAFFGHTNPSGRACGAGELLQADIGIRLDGFCSDLQRTWYFSDGNKELPQDLKKASDALFTAFRLGVEKMRPGVKGYEVDLAARESLKAAGYPEFYHAFGHQVGREVHDGGTVLGRRLNKYGNMAEKTLEEGNVFAVEISVQVPGRGWIGLEECVLVTSTGHEFLSEPAEGIIVV